MASAISSGAANRPIGVRFSTAAVSYWPLSMTAWTMGVRVLPGATALTRMPRDAHSTARFSVSWRTAALATP